MRKTIFIILLVTLCFIIEFLIYNFFGRWFMPNLLLLLVIFFNLGSGIRFSLLTAVLAGIIKDSFSTSVFGVNLFSFVVCAYLTTFLKRYIYMQGSNSSRLLLVFVICVINLAVQYVTMLMFRDINFIDSVRFVLLPEILTTLIVAPFIFHYLRKCVLKYFVS